MSNYRGKKASILDLSPHMGKKVRVRFQGGREVVGVLRGYDPMVNIVVDEAVEYLRSAEDPYVASGETRPLGRVVCRGTNVTMCAPEEGYEEIANPFAAQPEEAAAGGD
jgi:U6 snRNA-associated Sm-like protein LSm7